MVCKGFDQKSKGISFKSASKQNELLAEEFHKPIGKKFKKRKVNSLFKDNIWGAILGGMQLISKFNKTICFLLCAIDIFSKYMGYSFKR